MRKVKDSHMRLDDQEILDLHATTLILGVIRVVNGLEFELPLEGAQISWVREENGVMEDLGEFLMKNEKESKRKVFGTLKQKFNF